MKMLHTKKAELFTWARSANSIEIAYESPTPIFHNEPIIRAEVSTISKI